MTGDAGERLRLSLRRWPDGKGLTVEPLSGGGNNRVFVLRSGETPVFCAKVYFREKDGSSARFATEQSFYRVCGESVGGQIPAAARWDECEHVAMFAWVTGRKTNQPTPDDIAAAGRFIRRLQEAGEADSLGPASDACWSEAEHVGAVSRRVERLGRFAEEGALTPDLADFVHQEIIPAWRRIAEMVSGAETSVVAELVASPSDFGFHNAMFRDDGTWCFVDFEYAGRDDAAKLACDFVARPGAGLAPGSMELFCDAAGFSGRVLRRAERMLPVHRLKWACIALNRFLPDAARRKIFAGQPEFESIQQQLSMVRGLLTDALRGHGTLHPV